MGEETVGAELVGLLVVLGGCDDDPSLTAQGGHGDHTPARRRHALEDACRRAPAEAAIQHDDDSASVGRVEPFGELVHGDGSIRQGVEPGVLRSELVRARAVPSEEEERRVLGSGRAERLAEGLPDPLPRGFFVEQTSCVEVVHRVGEERPQGGRVVRRPGYVRDFRISVLADAYEGG
jgi:hypothetical protein